jgi:ribosomal protein S9
MNKDNKPALISRGRLGIHARRVEKKKCQDREARTKGHGWTRHKQGEREGVEGL